MLAILIIDNNDTFRESLRRLLSERYPRGSVHEAEDGRDALHKLQSTIPDVVFMNIRLPDLNGLEVLREIRKQSGRAIIVVLGEDDIPEYREAALGCGADHFVAMSSSTQNDINVLLDTVVLWASAMGADPHDHIP